MTRLLLALIALWQRLLSPLLPTACRFHPTCSHYTCQAIERHGLVRGLRLAVWRLARCQPFSRGGLDPVP